MMFRASENVHILTLTPLHTNTHKRTHSPIKDFARESE